MRARWWKRRWFRRLGLRYLYYCKQHWIIAGVATVWVLWFVLQIGLQLLPLALEFMLAAV